MKVVVVYPLEYPFGEPVLRQKVEVVRPVGDDEASLAAALADADGIVIRGPAKLTAMLIDAAAKLKVIAAQGAGTDNIDVAAATRRKIPVVYGAGVAYRAVAEYTLSAMVVAHRGFLDMHHALTSRPIDWVGRLDDFQRTELTGTTLGIVGFGNIGRAVARMARAAYEMDVLAYDPFAPEAAFAGLATRATDLLALCSAAQTVTVHVPLLPSTRGLLRRAHLRAIGTDGVLVNVSRGGTVDEADLVAALAARELKGAVIDVFENEPPRAEQLARLAAAPNILLTPHCAGITDLSLKSLVSNAVNGVLDVLEGRRPKVVLNPEVFG